jgi:hypothetical protein
VKYMIMIHANPQLWESYTPEQVSKAIAEQDAFNTKYTASGEMLGAYGMGDPSQARQVSVRDGLPAVTDGPYLETKEHLSSWNFFDVDSEERILEIAAEMPFAADRSVEVWPILHEAPGSL